MSAPSPACTVADGAGAATAVPPSKQVTPGNTVTIALISSAGVDTWTVACTSTDDLGSVATINAGLTVNNTTKTATFTAPAAGNGMVFTSTVTQSGVAYSTTFKIYTLSASGLQVAAVGERFETDATFGWAKLLNQVLRTGIPGTPSGAAGGNLGGTYPNPTVVEINGATVPVSGALTTGNGLYVSGVSALSYSALNLAGGSGYVTGVLPAANQASQTMTGDVTGTTAASVVAKANGATVPAAGALTTGNGLYVSGASALSYSALNLAGGSGWVTGTLPAANLPVATTGAEGIVQLAGSIGGTATSVTVLAVDGSSGNAPINCNQTTWGTAPNEVVSIRGTQSLTSGNGTVVSVAPPSSAGSYTLTFKIEVYNSTAGVYGFWVMSGVWTSNGTAWTSQVATSTDLTKTIGTVTAPTVSLSTNVVCTVTAAASGTTKYHAFVEVLGAG